MEVNLLLISLLVNVTRVATWILWLLFYLAVVGAIGVLSGASSPPVVFIEYREIAINALYYCYFFQMIGNDYERAFLTYVRIAYWFAILALPVWAVTCIAEHGYVRLAGLATEPAQFCLLVLPAYYWYGYQFLETRKHAAEVAIFTLTVALSLSSIGWFSVAFGIMLLLSSRGKNVLAVAAIICAVLGIAYAASSDFRVRVNDTLVAAGTVDFTGINSSTFILLSNAYVTRQVLAESPLFGKGLGSHFTSHARFVRDLQGLEWFEEYHLIDGQALDGASLTLRTLSEFGILGYLAILIFVYHFHVGGKGPHAAISNAILICFFLKLVRSGEYAQPEQFFFIFIYILNYRDYKSHAKTTGYHSSEYLHQRQSLFLQRPVTKSSNI